jgi:hypothetical protein
MKTTCTRLVFVIPLLVALSAHPRATVLVGADLGELAHDAMAIARGRVVAVDAQWTDGRRSIETIVTLDVDAYLKGSLGPSVQFRVPGGMLGRYRSIVVGAPTFEVNERVVVFLGARGPAVPHVLGFSQGVYRVVAESSGWVVTPPAVLPVAGRTTIVRGDRARGRLPLGEFEQRVRVLAGATK